mgnify:CR=1 FL=1
MDESLPEASHFISVPYLSGTVDRYLPIREVSPGVRLAILDILGDYELIEALGLALAKLIPHDVTALFMPDGKAQALLPVLGCESCVPTIIARKSLKSYMAGPILSVDVVSITTSDKTQKLYLDSVSAAKLNGRKVAVVDDVVSTGASVRACEELVRMAGGEVTAVVAAFTEGLGHKGIISLGNLPLY